MSEPDDTAAADDTTETETYVDTDLQARLWLRAIIPVLQLPSTTDPPASVRVQLAVDQMLVAACARATRILGSDQSADNSDGL